MFPASESWIDLFPCEQCHYPTMQGTIYLLISFFFYHSHGIQEKASFLHCSSTSWNPPVTKYLNKLPLPPQKKRTFSEQLPPTYIFAYLFLQIIQEVQDLDVFTQMPITPLSSQFFNRKCKTSVQDNMDRRRKGRGVQVMIRIK